MNSRKVSNKLQKLHTFFGNVQFLRIFPALLTHFWPVLELELKVGMCGYRKLVSGDEQINSLVSTPSFHHNFVAAKPGLCVDPALYFTDTAVSSPGQDPGYIYILYKIRRKKKSVILGEKICNIQKNRIETILQIF